MKNALISAAFLATTIAMPASAAVTVFAGSDDGFDSTGPLTNANAAEAAFLAAVAAYGPVFQEQFETTPSGYNLNLIFADFAIALTGPDYGPSFSGISDTDVGPLNAFNTTPGGANWLGFPTGNATFTFAAPTHAFGFYLTGIQTINTSVLTLTQLDGTSATYNIPINVDGGATYFGIVDSDTFTQVQIATNVPNFDAWGIDGVSYTVSAASGAVPEPGIWVAMLAGFALTGASLRRPARGIIRPV